MDSRTATRKLGPPNPGGPVVALVGNPNCGKTTFFNALTGERRETGNWPGVTVQSATARAGGRAGGAMVVDLPGAYDLVGYSEDEEVTRDFLLAGSADAVLNVVDATNLERNLYLTIRLLEAKLPVVVALNLADAARARGLRLEPDALARGLGVPVLETVAVAGEGIHEALAAAVNLAARSVARRASQDPVRAREEDFRVDYGPDIEKMLAATSDGLTAAEGCPRPVEPRSRSTEVRTGSGPDARWLAIRRLESDGYLPLMAARRFELAAGLAGESVRAVHRGAAATPAAATTLSASTTPNAATTPGAAAPADAVTPPTAAEAASWSDRLDRVATHRFLGVGILLAVMGALFKFTFTLGTPLTGLVSQGLAVAGRLIGSLLTSAGVAEAVRSFVVDGLLAGVGSVAVFFPLVFILFFALAVLEESGYMSRAACVSDRFMHALGLGGKAFIPLVLGFGCNVPAILATRTLDSRRDRLVTILVSPLMSCSGRLPVYTLFAGAFFGARQGVVVFGVYLLGAVMALAMAKLLTARFLPGDGADFVLELPPYRWPPARAVLRQAWWRSWTFIRKAGTIIAAGVVVMWALGSLPGGVAYASRDSLLGRLGLAAAEVLRPAGLGNWETGTSLVFGLAAKEFVVAALGLVHGAGDQALPALLRTHFTPLTALAFMVMALFYSPCLATVAAIRKETASWRWPAFAFGYNLLLGLAAATLVYQVGRLLGAG